MVKNLHCNPGDVGSIHGQGTKVPHTEKPLSSHNATTEPTQLESLCTLRQPKIFFKRRILLSTEVSNSLEKTLMLGRIKGRRRRGQQRMR